MKVIGKIENDRYICEVSHKEIEKYFNLYYGKKEKLVVGAELDLSMGYDYSDDIKNSVEDIKKFIEGSEKIANAITMGLINLSRKENNQWKIN